MNKHKELTEVEAELSYCRQQLAHYTSLHQSSGGGWIYANMKRVFAARVEVLTEQRRQLRHFLAFIGDL